MRLVILCAGLFGLLASAAPTGLEERQSGCKKVTVIYARGTIELAPFGSIVGPQFSAALNTVLGSGNVNFKGVTYPAGILGYLIGGSPLGAANLAVLAEQAVSNCPSTQLVLSGYSQGAQVVHLGVKQLSSSTAAKVAAIVVFGDPKDGQGFSPVPASNTVTYCADGDLICDGLAIVGAAHLSYAVDATAAAAFVKSKVKV